MSGAIYPEERSTARAVLYPEDGPPRAVELALVDKGYGPTVDLSQVYDLLSCETIDSVYCDKSSHVLVDDVGMLDGRPCRQFGGKELYGPVLHLGTTTDGSTVDLPRASALRLLQTVGADVPDEVQRWPGGES